MDEKHSQEIKDLEKQLDENPEVEAPVKTENVEPEPESTPPNGEEKESKILEEDEDGDIFVKVQKDGTEADPQGESDEDKPQEPEEGTVEEDTSPYAQKTREELIEMHENAQHKISEQGNELGNLRQTVQKIDPQNVSPEDLLESLSSEDIEMGIAVERQSLLDMDPYETEQVENQKALIADMENDLVNKRTDERLDDRFTSEDNTRLIEEQRETFKAQGIDLTDEEYDHVTNNALDYHENGRIDTESFHKAMIDSFGADKVATFYQLQGQKKVRDEISNAETKTYPKVDVAGSGKNSKLVRIRDMSERDLNNTLDSLSLDELNALKQRLNK
jgi:hypothetical protein